MSQLVLKHVKWYNVFVVKANGNARQASLIPHPTPVKERVLTGPDYFVIGRDARWTHSDVYLTYNTKNSRRNKTPPITLSYPRPPTPFEDLPFVGVYYATFKLNQIIPESERYTYLLRRAYDTPGGRIIPMFTTGLKKWMDDTRKEYPIIDRILEKAGPSYRWDPSTARAQFSTILDKIAQNPFELKTLTGHKSSRTVYDHYVKSTSAVIRGRKIDYLGKFVTGLGNLTGKIDLRCQDPDNPT